MIRRDADREADQEASSCCSDVRLCMAAIRRNILVTVVEIKVGNVVE